MRLMLVIILTFKVSIYRARVAETGELEETPILLEVEKSSSFLADIGENHGQDQDHKDVDNDVELWMMR